MWPLFHALLTVISTVFRSRLSLQLEVVARRDQLSVYRRSDIRVLKMRVSVLTKETLLPARYLPYEDR